MNALSVGPMSPALDFRSREFRLAAACAALSVALHAAFLFGSRMSDFRAAPASAPAGSGVEVRLTNVESTEPPARERMAAVESQWRSLDPIAQRSVRARQYPAMLEFRPVDLPPRAFDEKAYRALSAVTVAPTPVRPVAVPYPEGVAVAGTVTARLTLFIDEDGNVARLIAGETQVPDAFVQAAKDAFEPAKFRPAEVDGTPVKVRMVIDVEFEDQAAKRARRNRAKGS
jgi:hypothetical protein